MKRWMMLIGIAVVVWSTKDGKSHYRVFNTEQQFSESQIFYDQIKRNDDVEAHGFAYSFGKKEVGGPSGYGAGSGKVKDCYEKKSNGVYVPSTCVQ